MKKIIAGVTLAFLLMSANAMAYVSSQCVTNVGTDDCRPNYIAYQGCVTGVGAGTDIFLADTECEAQRVSGSHDNISGPVTAGTGNTVGVDCNSTAAANFSTTPNCQCNTGYSGYLCDSCASGYIMIGAVCVKETSVIYDADKDTLVQTEESADENIVRFDAGGTEVGTLSLTTSIFNRDIFGMGSNAAAAIAGGVPAHAVFAPTMIADELAIVLGIGPIAGALGADEEMIAFAIDMAGDAADNADAFVLGMSIFWDPDGGAAESYAIEIDGPFSKGFAHSGGEDDTAGYDTIFAGAEGGDATASNAGPDGGAWHLYAGGGAPGGTAGAAADGGDGGNLYLAGGFKGDQNNGGANGVAGDVILTYNQESATWGGSVGIGIDAPTSLQEIADAGSVVSKVSSFSVNNTNAASLTLSKADLAAVGALTSGQTDSGDYLGLIQFQGVNSSSERATGGVIQVNQNGIAGATHLPAEILFYTNSGSGLALAMAIDDTQYVAIGDATPDNPFEVEDIAAPPTVDTVNVQHGAAAQPSAGSTSGFNVAAYYAGNTGSTGNAAVTASAQSEGLTTTGNLIAGVEGVIVSDAADAAGTFMTSFLATYVDNAGSEGAIAYSSSHIGADFDIDFASIGGDLLLTGLVFPGNDGTDVYLVAPDGNAAAAELRNGGDAYVYGGALKNGGADGDVILAYASAAVQGNVGIGVGTPEQQLHIQAIQNGNAIMMLDADGGDDNNDSWLFRSDATTHDYVITNHTDDLFYFTDAGYLGVGTAAAPTTAFQVVDAAVQTLTMAQLTSGGSGTKSVTDDIGALNVDMYVSATDDSFVVNGNLIHYALATDSVVTSFMANATEGSASHANSKIAGFTSNLDFTTTTGTTYAFYDKGTADYALASEGEMSIGAVGANDDMYITTADAAAGTTGVINIDVGGNIGGAVVGGINIGVTNAGYVSIGGAATSAPINLDDGIAFDQDVVSGDYTITAFSYYLSSIDTGGDRDIGFPDSLLTDGRTYVVYDQDGDADLYPVAIVPASKTVNGTDELYITQSYGAVTVIADGNQDEWIAIGDHIYFGDGADQSLSDDGAITCGDKVERVVGNGGAVVLDADPAINDGENESQTCIIQGTHDTNTVLITDGLGVELAGGVDFTLGKGDTLMITWDDDEDTWYEISRSDN